MNRAALAALTLLLAGALASCLPGATALHPDAVLLNGPRADFVLEAGATLQRIADERALPFTVAGDTTARFLETRSGLIGNGAPGAAARAADNLGAEIAVLVGVPLRERTIVEDAQRGERTVTVTIRLEALVIAADGRGVLSTVVSRSLSGQRIEPLTEPLAALEDDPTVAALAVRAAGESADALFEAVASALTP